MLTSTNFKFEAIGTHWQINLPEDIHLVIKNKIINEITDFIFEFDKTYSRFREDSIVTLMSTKEGQYELPASSKNLINIYKELYDLTKGAFTPLVGQLLSDVGYNKDYTLVPNEQLIQPEKWDEVLDYDSRNYKLKLKKPVLLDFGAAGKGYLIDLIADLLQKYSLDFFLIDAGGDIYYKNQKQADEHVKVALENPANAKEAIGTSRILNQAIAASATNRRTWGKYNHIINPFTLKSVTDVKASWVIANNATMADAIATCLFLVGPDVLKGKYDFSYAILDADFRLSKSEDFPGEFFI